MSWLIGLILYYLPTIIAFIKKTPNKLLILGINFLLGWTVIGWIVPLIIAIKTKGVNEPTPPVEPLEAAIEDNNLQTCEIPSSTPYSETNVSTAPYTVDGVSEFKTETIPSTLYGIPLAYKYDNVNVTIIEGKRPDFSQLVVNMPITFIPEPNNPYDSKAVIVRTNIIDIGYLYKGPQQEMVLDYLKRGDPIKAFITGIDESENSVKITMGFYKEKENIYDKLMRLEVPFKTFKLTGNRNKDMQDTLTYCSEHEQVEYEFDHEKEKYLAVCGDEIGYFPKAAEKYLENDCPAFIEEIEENEDDKYAVKVAVFLE